MRQFPNRNIWNVDRLPTRAERALGTVGAIVLVGVFGYLAVFCVLSYIRLGDQSLLATAGMFLLLLAVSGFLLLRLVLTSPRRPGIRSSGYVAVAMIGLGFAMLALSVISDDVARSAFMFAVGLTSAASGILRLASTRSKTDDDCGA